ncbi:subtilisin-like protein [Terfezia boudieri ATCC MYA-4762]|uniref:Subtilisin-like protein n=1 Tax=Terfezia boudieri ATCC MYA-4762 TaxID=1051890 RepID=A0A3N4LWI1_9PEZI|nr:subtilisin-like protein [Terfezia boudieri ATCC MYA-4762]
MMWQTFSGLSFLSLASVFASTAKGLRYDQGPAQMNSAHIPFIVPGKFIVEFQDGTGGGGNTVDHFFGNLRDMGIRPVGGLNFTGSSIFEGCSFQVDKTTNPGDILALDVVKNIWPVKSIAVPTPKIVSKGESTKAPIWTSHAGTGVLDMHRRGYMGEGVVIAIVDTGIDYTNPALGGSVGPGKKIISGWDFVGDAWQPDKEPAPNDDIMDCKGHGTHVAGIVAGEPEDGRFISVAPKAKLRGYKVFGCEGITDTSTLIAAFLKAYEDGVDIINASIGGPEGWTEGAWQVVADRLVKQGVFIAMSAGNEGEVGSWYAASGATGTDVLSVASINNEQLYVVGAEARSGNEKKSITYIDTGVGVDGWQLDKDLQVYATSLNISEAADACVPLPESTPDLKGKLVVVRRGTCTFAVKEKNVAAKGGQYLMFYTDDRPVSKPTVEKATIKYIGMLDAPTGVYLVNSFAAKKKTSVFFPKGGIVIPNNTTGGYASDFTQWGPSWEAFMKPEIGAPGGNILSTYLMKEGGYAILSGTSMATPYISGIAALFIGKTGRSRNLDVGAALELKKRIISSGRTLDWNDGKRTDPDKYAPIAQIGGGYVNATKVLTYDTSVSPAKLELNDTMFFKPEHFIDVRNSGHSVVKYTVTHLPIDTFYTFEPGYTTPKIFPPNLVEGVASVQFSSAVFMIGPGMEFSFKVSFTPPQGLNEVLLPVYGGKIVITGDNGERLEIPYLGIGGSIKAQKVWDQGWGIPQIQSKEEPIADQPHNFTLQGDDRPIFTFINDWGSREIRVDVVTADWIERDWRYPPVVGENQFVGSIVTADDVAYPSYFETRHNRLQPDLESTRFNWTGAVSDGSNQTQIKPGKYRFNMRALKVFGDPGLAGDWQSVTSPVFTVLDVSNQPAP